MATLTRQSHAWSVRRGALAAAALASSGAVAALWAVQDRGVVAELDEEIARWVAAELPAWAEWVSRPFSWLGGAIGLGLVAAVASLLLSRAGRRRDAALVVLAYAGSQLSMLAVKAATDRPRPNLDPAVPLPGSSAFPSGHATGAVAVLCLTALLLAPPRRRVQAAWAAGVLAAAVGASRVLLGVHWPSDVVAGWAFGLAWLALCLLLRRRR